MGGLRWARKTRQKIANELAKDGVLVSANTVGRILKTMGYSLRTNRKMLSTGNDTPHKRKERNQQFGVIRKIHENFVRSGNPVISVDTKKKEKVGNFKNEGTTWGKEAVLVNDHDFATLAEGDAIPRGVYDVQRNKGFISVGISHDTPEFAVDSVAKWWEDDGSYQYHGKKALLILADAGGSNSARSTMWKYYLQTKICDQYNITVTVCHYPTGASKWNPIEHRMFGPISQNWAGVPLRSYETILKYIRKTVTKTGLTIKAYLNRKKYQTKQKLNEDQKDEIFIEHGKVFPNWNYTIKPKNVK